jgi:hypothetical protein
MHVPQAICSVCANCLVSWVLLVQVTAPQLALLEETMSRMERVAAWLLVRAACVAEEAIAIKLQPVIT